MAARSHRLQLRILQHWMRQRLLRQCVRLAETAHFDDEIEQLTSASEGAIDDTSLNAAISALSDEDRALVALLRRDVHSEQVAALLKISPDEARRRTHALLVELTDKLYGGAAEQTVSRNLRASIEQ